MNKKCKQCENGYVMKNGLYLPCKNCITPERFKKTLDIAIKNCKVPKDSRKKRALMRIQENLPDYPVVALMEAEFYGGLGAEFITMLQKAFNIRPFKDVEYKKMY